MEKNLETIENQDQREKYVVYNPTKNLVVDLYECIAGNIDKKLDKQIKGSIVYGRKNAEKTLKIMKDLYGHHLELKKITDTDI